MKKFEKGSRRFKKVQGGSRRFQKVPEGSSRFKDGKEGSGRLIRFMEVQEASRWSMGSKLIRLFKDRIFSRLNSLLINCRSFQALTKALFFK